MWNLNIWILVTILTCTNGYDRKCPHSSQWNFTSRSYECSDQKIYICLFDAIKSYASKAVFTASCGPEDLSREGFRYIVTPDLHQVRCTASRYQPFTFTTNGNSQCVLSKSLCNARGQILANNGISSTDRSCRCDYTQNYDYVIPPKDPCSCKPAEEDCSCYVRKCDDDKEMIADYRCLKRVETILPEDIKCPIINRIIPPEETDTVYKIQWQSVVTGSRTWSKQASVILIVVVIIYTVLIGFLFCSVPHVTSILLKSRLKLSLKRKENEFMILNGDNVKIECNVKSYIPVRSVTWQKEIDGEIKHITPSMEKYEMNCEKRPSLTIDNFNAGDQGKYRCIVRNAVGLRNEMFVSCSNFMSRVGWLKGFVTVLQHIPAFHNEDMTLHSYDIDLQSKQTVYNVYKGDDITMEFNDQQKLIAVKWFKKNDIWTELDISNEQFSGGVPDVPSLTIKVTRIRNAGKYLCLLIYDNGETQKALFKLKIILQVKFYKALCEHREDRTFIRPAICDNIDKYMQENNIVVITGREGTGKSKICLELASFYDEKDYMVLKVDLSENHSIYTDIGNALLIIDDQQYTQDSLNAFMKDLLPVLPKRNIQVILTCRNLDLKIVRNVPEMNKLKSEAFININNCLTPEEKEEMLRRYMKENNIASSASYDSNFRDPKILTDFSVQVRLDEDAIKIIKNEEPWKGFPLCASSFCSDRKLLHLGEKHFTNPPRYLFEELRELYETSRRDLNHANCILTIIDYCVLVYVMKNHQLTLNDNNLYIDLVELYQTLFQFRYIPEKPGSNEDQKKAIEEALHRMTNKYLTFNEGVYEFLHPCLFKAMFLSSNSVIPYLIQNGSLHDITEFVRCEVYTGLENELVININNHYHHILCERLVRHALEDRSLLLHVAQYIYSYWHSSGNNLVNMMFKHIEFILFNSLGVQTSGLPSLDNRSLSENNIKLEGKIKLSNIIVLVDELTYKGRDPWIYGPGTSDFLIISALVSAAVGRYETNRDQTFKILLKEFQNRIHLESFVKLLGKPLDMYGNTFFHYLMGLSQKETSAILSANAEMKYTFDTENVKKYSPLDIAAFLGKRTVLEDLRLRTNFTKKLRDRLKRLAESGNAEYYDDNSKNKNIDQPIVHKTNFDSASPENLESEDADDEKKEVKDESKKDTRFLKRTFSLRKEESNKKEKHDVNDVLCFEDFMKNIVVFGKKKDYQSIIKLLSY
ncbi:uncharacterized protein LOC127710315 isoform X2 [Mytilus californianus]|uniref:uncharacterized protein LOC127710315 isoform X2 n=1 Tax=Mytilus californianus TaxID=6549 RepID=UPI0022451AC6|nr:uncharacterized protein LOC127710315 isoform X2 [Mytilus californianus]